MQYLKIKIEISRLNLLDIKYFQNLQIYSLFLFLLKKHFILRIHFHHDSLSLYRKTTEKIKQIKHSSYITHTQRKIKWLVLADNLWTITLPDAAEEKKWREENQGAGSIFCREIWGTWRFRRLGQNENQCPIHPLPSPEQALDWPAETAEVWLS